MTARLEFAKMHLKDYQTMHLKDYQTYGEAWWWHHDAVGMFFSSRDWETSQDRGKDDVQKDP